MGERRSFDYKSILPEGESHPLPLSYIGLTPCSVQRGTIWVMVRAHRGGCGKSCPRVSEQELPCHAAAPSTTPRRVSGCFWLAGWVNMAEHARLQILIPFWDEQPRLFLRCHWNNTKLFFHLLSTFFPRIHLYTLYFMCIKKIVESILCLLL